VPRRVGSPTDGQGAATALGRAGELDAYPQDRIRVFRDPRLLAVVAIVPVLTTAALIAFRFFPGDPMLATGLGAVMVGFGVFLVFTTRIGDVFELIRLRGLVPAEAAGEYAAFEHEVERALNSRWSAIPVIVGGLIGFARFPVAHGGLDFIVGDRPDSLRNLQPLWVADMLAESLVGMAAGLAIWRMVVLGIKVNALGRRFPLRLQLGHPDRCGGFEPLGSLCLWNALILSVPGVFLGWWIIAGPTSQYGDRYVALHSGLASLVVLLATIAFVLPLWGVHRAMERSAVRVREDIERQGQRIDQLARELVAAKEDLAPEAWDAKAKDLERRQALYKANERVPAWPIDVRLAVKFGTSQLVPLLGLTGLGKPLVDVIRAVSSAVDAATG
jgi:hypothetical protein